MKHYGLYLGDKFLFVGTRKECAEFRGVKEETISWYLSKSYKNRCKGSNNRLVVVAFNYDERKDVVKL